MRHKNKNPYGVGHNDADYNVTSVDENGKKVTCPYYKRWEKMLERCYSESYHKIRPTYVGCYVCDEWLWFMTFKRWMMKQDWKNKQLDKDIISVGNKIYSPTSCCFVDIKLNTLISTCQFGKQRGIRRVQLKNGFYYIASITIKGKQLKSSKYRSQELAAIAYNKLKRNAILEESKNQKDIRIRVGLINIANTFNITPTKKKKSLLIW